MDVILVREANIPLILSPVLIVPLAPTVLKVMALVHVLLVAIRQLKLYLRLINVLCVQKDDSGLELGLPLIAFVRRVLLEQVAMYKVLRLQHSVLLVTLENIQIRQEVRVVRAAMLAKLPLMVKLALPIAFRAFQERMHQV